MNASELANQTKFDDIQAQILAINNRQAAPSTPLSFAASQAGPVTTHSAPTPCTNPMGPAEDCLVFIRGFPTTQPGFILKEYATEALALLPTEERAAVRTRVSPADTQFSFVFPSAGMAASFVSNYRAMNFVYIDPDKNQTPLTCRTGKPIALRRRGGLIRPVYSVLEEELRNTPALATATISQTSKPRNGVMSTEFFALKGRVLTLLFTLVFKETPEESIIVRVTLPADGSPLSDDSLDRIKRAAIPE
jgi:hypothetical protein